MDKKMYSEEVVSKLKDASCAEEVLAIAKAEGIQLTQEESEQVLAEVKKNAEGEISDDDLDAVSGGSSYVSTGGGGYGELITTSCNSCPAFQGESPDSSVRCGSCVHSHYNGTYLLCNERKYKDDKYGSQTMIQVFD